MNGGIIRAGLGIYPSKGHLPPFGSGVIVKLKTSWRQLITRVYRKIGYIKNYDFTALLSSECQLRIQINAINFEFFTHSCTRFLSSEDKKSEIIKKKKKILSFVTLFFYIPCCIKRIKYYSYMILLESISFLTFYYNS